MARASQTFEVTCPDCGAVLKVDAVSQAVIAHTPAPRKRTFEDLGAAARDLKERESRRDSLFAQSVQAERNRDDLLDKKFAEAVKKAKDNPNSGKPLRDFDLD